MSGTNFSQDDAIRFWAEVLRGTLKPEFWEQAIEDSVAQDEFTPELAEAIREELGLSEIESS